MRSAAVVMAAEYVAAGGARRPVGGRARPAARRRAGRDARLLAHARTAATSRCRSSAASPTRRGASTPSAPRCATTACRVRSAWPTSSSSPTRRRATTAQSALFKLPARPSSPRRRASPTPTVLPMLAAAAALDAVPVDERRAVLRERGPAALAEAGFSWERLSGWLPGGMDAEAWEAVIPSMGVMALVRNLRNFDEAGIARGGDRRGDRQDHRRRRGGQGAPVPVPGVGGVQARAVGQLEAGARPHARPHGRQHPGARRHARRDRHVGLDAGAGVEPFDSCQRVEVAAVMAMATAKRGVGRRRRDLRPAQRARAAVSPARRCSAASTRSCGRSARSATRRSATRPSPGGSTRSATSGWSSSPTTSSTTRATSGSTTCR